MKKLIVLSVVFVLLASAVFAADVSGEVQGLVVPVAGNTEKDSKITAGGEMKRIRIEASGKNDEGTFGGWVRLDPIKVVGIDFDADGFDAASKADPNAEPFSFINPKLDGLYGHVWWQPIDEFKLTIGGNPDGWFGADGVTRWGFYQTAGDVGVASESWAFGASFFGGWGGGFESGALLTITPSEALAVNIAIPFISNNGGAEAKDVYLYTNAQVAYTIADVGKFALTYVGNRGELKIKEDYLTDPTVEDPFSASGSTIYAYFNLSKIENLGIDIGVGYTLPVSESVELVPGVAASKLEVSVNAPIAAGLGVNFKVNDALGLKARVQGQFAGSTTVKAGGVSKDVKDPMVILADILPSYVISDNLAFLLSAGVGVTLPDGGDAVIGWHINPYVTVKSAGPNFFAGIRIDSAGGDDAIINWAVPIGMAVAF